jgi:hypothetical protein
MSAGSRINTAMRPGVTDGAKTIHRLRHHCVADGYIFQVWVRSGVCGDACGIAYLKAVVWALIWPASWVAYLSGYV